MIKNAILPLLAVLLVACGQQEQVTTALDKSKVVAKVGSDVITQNQLDSQVKKLTGLESLTRDQSLIRKNVIDSMVLAKLMAKKQENLMTNEQLVQLEIDVKAYREERLAQLFMSENVKTLPPSAEDVEAFYKSNLHRFGGGEFADVTRFVLGSGCLLPQTESASNAELVKKIKSLNCEKTEQKQSLLLAKLASEAGKNKDQLSLNTPVWLMTGNGQSIILINKIEERKAAPLTDVAAEIRKMLAPQQFKLAIAGTKSQLLKETEVEIFDN